MSRNLCAPLVVLLTLAAAAGCSSGGGSSGGGSASTAATPASTTTRSTTTPGSTTPRTGPSTSPTTSSTTPTGPTGTSNGPVITVTSPARASMLTQAATVVQGTVTDANPVVNCTINGNAVVLGAGGSFNEPVNLTEGLNVISVTATDSAGQTNKTSLSVLYGQYAPADHMVGNAMAIRLNQGSFNAVQALAAQQLTGAKLAALVTAKNPLATFNILGTACNIAATNASFGNPTLTLTPQQGYIAVHVDIPNVAVSISETNGAFLIPNFDADPTCDDATVDAQIAITVANGVVTTSVINDTVTLTNFQLNGHGILGWVAGLFNGPISGLVQSQIATMVKNTLPGQINQMIAGASGQPITQTILGTTATFQLAPNAITIDPQGVSADVDANCLIAPKAGFQPFTAPGSLVTTGAPPAHGGPTPDFFASINQDLLNRAGYEVWQSGLTRIVIDGSPNSIVKLPSWIPLDMGLLQTFMTELQGKANPADSIAFVVAPQLPAVFAPAAAPDNVMASIGELQLQIWDTTTNQLVLAIAIQTKVSANATVNAQNTFDLAVSQAPFLDVSLASSPMAPDLNITGVTNFVGFVVPPVVQILGNVWQGFPLPVYPGLNLNNVSIFQDGTAGNYLTVSGNVR